MPGVAKRRGALGKTNFQDRRRQSSFGHYVTSAPDPQIKNPGVKLSSITADAGYGSEENYQWLEAKHITAYVKDRDFDRHQLGTKSASILTGKKKTQQEKVLFCQKLFYQHYCAQF